MTLESTSAATENAIRVGRFASIVLKDSNGAVLEQWNSIAIESFPYSIQIELAPFTLIGATTRRGLLTSPLRARFGIDVYKRQCLSYRKGRT